MELKSYLAEERGRSNRFARELKVSPAFMSQMATGECPVPATLAPAVERLSGQSVRRWDLRPNDWHLIWPELVGAEGAPEVRALEGEARDAA